MPKGVTALLAFMAAIVMGCATVAFAQTGKRVALVIGNAEYRQLPPFQNGDRDATDVGAALERLGFEVARAINADLATLRGSIAAFQRSAANADAALVFYSGYSLRYRGSGYLVPVDATLKDDASFEWDTLQLAQAIGALARARASFLIVDSCGVDQLASAFQRSGGAASPGLGDIPGRADSLIAIASAAGPEGCGASRASVLVDSLLAEIDRPGLDARVLFRRVEQLVRHRSAGKQALAMSSGLNQAFAFAQGDTADLAFRRLGVEPDPAVMRGYVERYGDNPLSAIVKTMLLQKEQAPQRPGASPQAFERWRGFFDERWSRERQDKANASRRNALEGRWSREDDDRQGAERARIAREQEEQRKREAEAAEQKRQAELAAAAEKKRQDDERARIAREQDEQRKREAEFAEQKRQAELAVAEKKRQDEEKLRIAREQEEQRKREAEIAEQKRQAEFAAAEKKRQDEEKARIAREQDEQRRREAEIAEQKRQAELAAAAEKKRQDEEKLRIAREQDEQRRREAELAEQKRQAELAAAERKRQDDEKARLADEKRQADIAAATEKKRQDEENARIAREQDEQRKREAEAAAAERKRVADLAVAEKRRAEQEKLEREKTEREEKARIVREQEEQRKKQAEIAAAERKRAEQDKLERERAEREEKARIVREQEEQRRKQAELAAIEKKRQDEENQQRIAREREEQQKRQAETELAERRKAEEQRLAALAATPQPNVSGAPPQSSALQSSPVAGNAVTEARQFSQAEQRLAQERLERERKARGENPEFVAPLPSESTPQIQTEQPQGDTKLANLAPAPTDRPAANPDFRGDSPDSIKAAQQELKRLGCYSGNINGNLNNGTKNALDAAGKKLGATASLQPLTEEGLRTLREHHETLCPPPTTARRPPRDEDEDEPAARPRPRPRPAQTQPRPAPAPRPQPQVARPAPAPSPTPAPRPSGPRNIQLSM